MRTSEDIEAEALRRLSPTALRFVSYEIRYPSSRYAIRQALHSADPERELLELASRRVAHNNGLGDEDVETYKYGQFRKMRRQEIREARATGDKEAVYAAKHRWKGEKLSKPERQEIVAEIGKAGSGYHWAYKRDTQTGQLVAVRVENKESGNFFSKIGRAVKPFVPIIIGVAGAVLAPFTGGASLAAAAVLSAAYSINQKRIATNKAKRENQAVAKQMQAEVDAQTKDLNVKLDALFSENKTTFEAAGISSSQWSSMSTDQKLAIVERINSGKMPSTPENVIAASEAKGTPPPATLPPQQPVQQSIESSPFMQPENSVSSAPGSSGGGGGLLVLAAGAAVATKAMKLW